MEDNNKFVSPNAWAYTWISMFKLIQIGSCFWSLSATVCVSVWVLHVINSNRVVRPDDLAKVGIQKVYKTGYKNYGVIK